MPRSGGPGKIVDWGNPLPKPLDTRLQSTGTFRPYREPFGKVNIARRHSDVFEVDCFDGFAYRIYSFRIRKESDAHNGSLGKRVP